jgi:hypothetical protein
MMTNARTAFLLHLVAAAALAATPLAAQVLPDRIVVLDPMSDRSLDTAGFTWLNGARLYAEFARYTPGDRDHRWNAKTGGVVEVLRWDSTANVTIIGTMEVVVDPNNDIAFNPRAIFWEEGVLVTVAPRLEYVPPIQIGYVHRCKHDIDNLEILVGGGPREQRTLIFSGILVRMLLRETPLVTGDWIVSASGSLRLDRYLHRLDDRLDPDARLVGNDIEEMVQSSTLTARINVQPAGARWRAHLLASGMLTEHGADRDRDTDELELDASLPFVELGFDLFNPAGSSFTIFLRYEHQRDAGIGSIPTSASLTMLGVRVADMKWIW